MDEKVKIILKQFHVSRTRARMVMLDLFLQTGEAVTHQHFLNDPSLRLDRTTIFRTLNLFVEKKIVLRIPFADGLNRYLIRQTKDRVQASFLCHDCKKIIPLQLVIQPKAKLPKGFKVENTEIMMTGLCDSCRARRKDDPLR